LDRLESGDFSEGEVMDQLNLTRYCCRRMIMTHVDLIEKLLRYEVPEKEDDRGNK